MSSQDVRTLVPGVVIERELAGGEAHSYQIALTSGQYVHIFVEARWVHVIVTLFGPDDKKLSEVDSRNVTGGLAVVTMPISLVAEASGEYRLEVRSLEKDAAPGRYGVEIEELRTATPQDKSRVAAERAFVEGDRLRNQGMAESLRKSLEKFAEALPHWRAAGDQAQEVKTLNFMGEGYTFLSEYQQALDIYAQSLPLWKIVGDPNGEGWTLNNIGSVYNSLGEKQKALDYYTQALLVYQSLNQPRGQGITLTYIGSVYDSLGEKQQALDYLRKALPFWRAASDPEGEARAFHFIGAVYASLGDGQRALDYYNQALPLWRATGDHHREASTLNSIGTAYASLGEKQKALDYLGQALSLRHIIGDRRGQAYTLNNIGLVYASMGGNQKALDYYGQALPICQEVGDRSGEAYTLTYIGEVYYLMGEKQKALDFLGQALPIRRAVGDREGEANTLYNIARVERDRDNLGEARNKIEEALKLVESVRTSVVSEELRASYLATVQDYYEFYLDLLMRLHQREPTKGHNAAALQASERARARSLLDLLTEAHADIRQGVDLSLLERERRAQQQLGAKERYRMQLLSGKHTEEQAAAVEKELDVLLTEYREVERQIRTTSPHYIALTQPQPLSLKEIQQQVLDEDTLLLEYALGEQRSYLWAVTPTSISSFELPKRAQIEQAAKHVYQLLTAPNENVKGETDIQKMTRIARAEAEYPNAAAALSQMLLGPVAEQLGNKRLLIVSDGALQYIPFGALPKPVVSEQWTVDSKKKTASRDRNCSLSTDHCPLIVDHEIVHLLSASVLAVLRKELAGRKPAPKAVAVLADPVFQSNDPRVKQATSRAEKQTGKDSAKPSDTPILVSALNRSIRDAGLTALQRLRFTQQEADAIIALAPAKEGLKALDFAANKPTATSADLSRYRTVHFATHGLLNDQHPELSGVVLSLVDEQGRPQDGFLQLHEVYNLNLPAELVVLSACKTALGEEIKGEGLVGLTRGFMYAGAARVVASLWSVDDQPTAEFMKRFYQGMLAKGQRPAAALRAAQVAMWEKKKPPYYWAAFVLQGEWK